MVTRRIAEFSAGLTLSQVPTAGVEMARAAFIDCLGVTLAAHTEPIAGVLTRYLAEAGGLPTATALGLGVRTSPELAALAGGAMAHALDYDDVSEPLYGHPSVVLVPAVLAVAEATGASGQRALEGYMAGFEVGNAIGRAMNPHHYGLGWHATATLGSLGAAAAAARVLGLDAGQTETALGIAASMAGGIRRNFGSMTKPLHAGNAARAGVAAAMMARAGLTAASAIVEGAYGFAQLFGGVEPGALEAAAEGLGRRWTLEADGIWFKFYPCCASTHRSLDAVLMLKAAHGFTAADVAEVVSYVPAHIPEILIHPRPSTSLQGKFSLQYTVAAALLDGRIGLGSFTDEQIGRPAARELGERVRMEVVPASGEETEVEVRLVDGRRLSMQVVNPKGHPLNPLTPAELRAKFTDCASAFPGARAEAALAALERLESLDRIDSLLADLHGR